MACTYEFYTQDGERDKILNNAFQSSAMVREAFLQEYNYYQQLYENQHFLLTQNQQLFTSHSQPQDILSLQAQVVARIDQDLLFVDKLNNYLEPEIEPSHENGLTWSLYANQMYNVLLGAKALILDETAFNALIQGQLPEGLDNTPVFPIFFDGSGMYGSSELTFLSAALIEINLELQGSQNKIQDIISPDAKNTWVDQAAILHVTPIADAINLNEIDAQFADGFSFYFADEITPQGFVFVHSGFAYGGHRDEIRYPAGKEYGPEDSSSWIAKLIGAETLFSTVDELYTYRMSLAPEDQGYIPADWLASDDAKVMQVLSPIVIEDPFLDIQPGQIFAIRDFTSEDHTNEGIGGGTGLVLGLQENGNVLVLAYARDMPEIEGFGIYELPWQSNATSETMFFNVKPQSLSINEVLVRETAIPDLESSMSNNAQVSPISSEYVQHQVIELTAVPSEILI